MASQTEPGKPPGLIESVRRLGASMLALAQTRLALASIDLAEERDRLLRIAMLALASTVLFAFTIAAISGLLLVALWDEWRFQVLIGLLIAYALGGAWCVSQIRSMLRNAPALLETTLAELERDRDALRDSD